MMIEQFGRDVVTIEQTKVAESSKLLMQLMALMRQRLKENNIGIDLKEGANVRIDVDGKTVFRGNESDRKVDLKFGPEVLKKYPLNNSGERVIQASMSNQKNSEKIVHE